MAACPSCEQSPCLAESLVPPPAPAGQPIDEMANKSARFNLYGKSATALGLHARTKLPGCVEKAIRSAYPSQREYTGFQACNQNAGRQPQRNKKKTPRTSHITQVTIVQSSDGSTKTEITVKTELEVKSKENEKEIKTTGEIEETDLPSNPEKRQRQE